MIALARPFAACGNLSDRQYGDKSYATLGRRRVAGGSLYRGGHVRTTANRQIFSATVIDPYESFTSGRLVVIEPIEDYVGYKND